MLKYLKKIFVPALFVGVFLAQFYSAGVVYAEGDAICNGMITGTTVDGGNAGRNYFDAHGGPNAGINAQYYNNVVNLAVFGLGQGLAPGDRANAACVEKAAGNAYGQAYEYKLRGYVFNSNLGFISFNCEAGFNDAGEGNGTACGNINYGVYISPIGPDGTRKLFGYGWNPGFGWVNFQPLPLNWEPGDPVPGDIVYGVDMAVDGSLFGKAWDGAEVYMPFNGAKIFLPDAVLPLPVANDPEHWCDNKPFLCVAVDPYPEKLKFGFEPGLANVPVGEEMRVADGVDGYDVHLYLRNAQGNGPLDPAQYNAVAFQNSIRLNWTDTVKIDQTVVGHVDNSLVPSPWNARTGAIISKPLTFADFTPVAGEPGHYKSTRRVSSYAPTSDGNMSITTSTNPPYPFKNEQFVHDLGLGSPEPNDLVLKSITFNDLIANVGNLTVLPQGAVYPNGKVGMSMKFRAPIEVNTLYADDFQDRVEAYRSVPMNFKIGAKKWGNLALAIINSARVDFKLAYSLAETQNQPLCQGTDANFDFHFLNDFNGNVLPDAPAAGPPAVVTTKLFLNVVASTLFNVEKDVQAKATLPTADANPDALACATVAAPTLYTLVHYRVDANHSDIAYYSNKVPRIAGDQIANPAVVVHGNVFAQMVREIQQDVLIQTSGSVNVNIVRDTINENLEKYLTSAQVPSPNGVCVITSLQELAGPAANFTVNGCNSGFYRKMVIGDEQVLYFKGSQVVMNLDGGNFAGKWVIVSADGNIFIDGNIYNAAQSSHSISLVAFRSSVENQFYRTGNVYIGPCSLNVKNVQATIIADGSVFSYNGVKTFGVPGAVGIGIDSATGEPVWGSYAAMVGNLGCQLLIEGAIYSDNTIGGADIDKGDDPKNYLLIGGGKIINLPAPLSAIMRAQAYDLNYLRMFRLSIETSVEGLPVDQQCGNGLTNDDILQVKNNVPICGEIEPCDVLHGLNAPNLCDGINPFDVVSDGGDLVAPRDSASLAAGLQNDPVRGTEFDPVYIYYKAPAKDSFLFSKAGVVNVGGR